jgi:hypothetical protein
VIRKLIPFAVAPLAVVLFSAALGDAVTGVVGLLLGGVFVAMAVLFAFRAPKRAKHVVVAHVVDLKIAEGGESDPTFHRFPGTTDGAAHTKVVVQP